MTVGVWNFIATSRFACRRSAEDLRHAGACDR